MSSPGQTIPSGGYDWYGNLLTINSSKCSTPILGISVDPATNRVTTAGFNYDAAGNLLGDGVYNYAWDAEGHVTSAAGVTYSEVYPERSRRDGNGMRVKKSSGTVYWRDQWGRVLDETDLAGNLQYVYIYFAGRMLSRVSTTEYIAYADALGSTRSMTDATGHLCYDADLYPFGGERAYTSTCGQNYKFAGMERDPETGDDHTLFRQYASNYGRWLSPDPSADGRDVSNPQSLNRYAYATNNPTNLVDPLGLDSINPFGSGNDGCTWDGQTLTCPRGHGPDTSGSRFDSGPNDAISSLFAGDSGFCTQSMGLFSFVVYGCGGLWGPRVHPAKPVTKPGSVVSSFGIKTGDQTFNQCMAANSGNYSINGVLPSSAQNGATRLLLSNDVSQILFGDSSEGSAGLVTWEAGSRSFEAGVGEAMTAGRRTASIFDLNLAGTTGPAPMILGKTGAEKLAGWLTGVAELKMAIDVGLTGAQTIGCAIHQ